MSLTRRSSEWACNAGYCYFNYNLFLFNIYFKYCRIYLAICALEGSICVKFGRKQLPAVKLSLISLWIACLAVGTIFCVWISVWWAKYSTVRVLSLKGKFVKKTTFYILENHIRGDQGRWNARMLFGLILRKSGRPL
jgi:hypothetical protein